MAIEENMDTVRFHILQLMKNASASDDARSELSASLEGIVEAFDELNAKVAQLEELVGLLMNKTGTSEL